MAGRPINENLATAKLVGDKTYHGTMHECGTSLRYTSGGGCVHCARAKATEMREALKASRENRATAEAFTEIATEPLTSEPAAGIREPWD